VIVVINVTVIIVTVVISVTVITVTAIDMTVIIHWLSMVRTGPNRGVRSGSNRKCDQFP